MVAQTAFACLALSLPVNWLRKRYTWMNVEFFFFFFAFFARSFSMHWLLEKAVYVYSRDRYQISTVSTEVADCKNTMWQALFSFVFFVCCCHCWWCLRILRWTFLPIDNQNYLKRFQALCPNILLSLLDGWMAGLLPLHPYAYKRSSPYLYIAYRMSGGHGKDELAAGPAHDLDPKVIEVYQGIGQVMSRFTSGKIPKAFKVIPNLRNWEDILFLTEPESWSSHAVYQGTRLFVSNLNARMAQRFLNLVLLPHVRRDIREHKRLHFALFQALKKATFKPGAFYKGILLPLCASGTCTLREAVILSSVIKRCSIPVLHSAAALLRIAEMPYSGVNSFFIRVLLDKRYALPYRVIDALVDHFVSFSKEERLLPVVWHQSLLTFIQRYKAEIRREDKTALRELCKHQPHYAMTPEVLRELDASKSRGEKQDTVQKPAHVGIHVQENLKDLAPLVLMDN